MHPLKQIGMAERIGNRLARSFDWRLVRWMRLGDSQQVWYLKRLFAMQDTDLVVDVGGNQGQYASLIRSRVGYCGPMITVEPNPAMASVLQQRFRGDRNWALASCALGDADGTATLNVMRGHEMSSLLPPSAAATDRLEQLNSVQRTVQVPVQTLARLLQEHPLAAKAQRIYLKLDVQGFELQVLRGAKPALPRISALQAEASVIPLYDGMPGYLELMGEIEQMGFRLSFLPAHNYSQVPDMIDFDCHFVSASWLAERGYLRQSLG
ncbi:MAG: FkbM family methyltransferase [Rubrivivax sp.]